MSNLMEKASDLVKQIHACMRNVETCEAIHEEIKDLPFVFLDTERYIRMDGVITDEQMADLRSSILNVINDNKKAAEQFLMQLTGSAPEDVGETINEPEPEEEIPLPAGVEIEPQKKKPATINQEFEDAVNDMIERIESRKESKPKPVVLDVDEVRRLYLEEDMTLVEAAEILGTNRSTLYAFCKKHGLRKPSKKDREFRDVGTPSKKNN